MASADFAESGSTTDHFGHGTHVASIVAGAGARAAGARKGVAFGASLLNGKVLDDLGFGSESGIIAGMEWAARQARAAGTALGEPVNRWYTRLTGTSMATPHVAGAAAIMARRWPAWTPTRIKAVLIGTADPNPDLGVYEQGGGRLDIGHAIDQRLIARRANVDFGYFRYPRPTCSP